jgi:hypothetical protein
MIDRFEFPQTEQISGPKIFFAIKMPCSAQLPPAGEAGLATARRSLSAAFHNDLDMILIGLLVAPSPLPKTFFSGSSASAPGFPENPSKIHPLPGRK